MLRRTVSAVTRTVTSSLLPRTIIPLKTVRVAVAAVAVTAVASVPPAVSAVPTERSSVPCARCASSCRARIPSTTPRITLPRSARIPKRRAVQPCTVASICKSKHRRPIGSAVSFMPRQRRVPQTAEASVLRHGRSGRCLPFAGRPAPSLYRILRRIASWTAFSVADRTRRG